MAEKTKRVPEIELMKAVAIIGMIYVLVMEGSRDVLINVKALPGLVPYTFFEFLGGIPTAGVLMFAMGWGAEHSQRSTVKTFLFRALNLFLLGLYVNIIRDILPGLIDPEHFGSFLEHPWAILDFNILWFAALSMIFFAIMRWAEDNPILCGVFSLVVVLAIFAADFMLTPETFKGNQWLATLIGVLFRQNEYSWFPVVPWGIFPVMGYWAGFLYRRWENRFQFAIASLAVGVTFIPMSIAALMTKGLPLAAVNPGSVSAVDYYSLNIWNLVCAIGIICLEMAICFGILALTGRKIPAILADMSRHVMGIFLMQLVFIGPMMPLLINITDIWVNLLLGTIVLAATYVSVKMLINLKANFWTC